MRIPYGFELISDGTLEVNKDEANIVLISIWQEQAWEKLWICFIQNRYLLQPES